MSDLDRLKSMAENQDSELLRKAAVIIQRCHHLLIESGQLEINPPKVLASFCKED